MRTRTHPLDRFWSRVDRANGPLCWFWTGRLDDKGYGRFYPSGSKGVRPHRFSYELYYRVMLPPHSSGWEIDHLCRNRACVNPHHLQVVTRHENVKRSTVGEFHAAKTHCPHGHPYDENNTRIIYHKDGSFAQRQCRACGSTSFRKYRKSLTTHYKKDQ